MENKSRITAGKGNSSSFSLPHSIPLLPPFRYCSISSTLHFITASFISLLLAYRQPFRSVLHIPALSLPSLTADFPTLYPILPCSCKNTYQTPNARQPSLLCVQSAKKRTIHDFLAHPPSNTIGLFQKNPFICLISQARTPTPCASLALLEQIIGINYRLPNFGEKFRTKK